MEDKLIYRTFTNTYTTRWKDSMTGCSQIGARTVMVLPGGDSPSFAMVVNKACALRGPSVERRAAVPVFRDYPQTA